MNNIHDMRKKRGEIWDRAKAFLTERQDENGMLSAEDTAQYERMEQEVVDLGHAIERAERADALEREMNAPTASPLASRPEARPNQRTGRSSDEYKSAFWTAMGQNKPKLILLDIMLPEEDGMVILRKLRADPATRAIPVMMLTAKGTEYDTVLALDAGADDYVQKPFRMMELLSRIRALLRRAETYGTPAEQVVVYRVGGLEVSPSCHLVKVNGQDIALTLKEFELLCLLLFALSVFSLARGGFNPFIYFQF